MAFSAHFDHKICKETEQSTDRKTVTMWPVDCVGLRFEGLFIFLSISTFELCKYSVLVINKQWFCLIFFEEAHDTFCKTL